jgi:hypothetical protein
MNKNHIIAITGFFALFGVTLIHAQSEDGKTPDSRIRKLLTELGLKYGVTESNRFKLTLGLGASNGDRSQLVYVDSNTENYQDMGLREVWSIAYICTGQLPNATLRLLLKENETRKFGSWSIQTDDEGDDYVLFKAHIGGNATKKAFKSAVNMVSESADEMEKKLTGGDKW